MQIFVHVNSQKIQRCLYTSRFANSKIWRKGPIELHIDKERTSTHRLKKEEGYKTKKVEAYMVDGMATLVSSMCTLQSITACPMVIKDNQNFLNFVEFEMTGKSIEYYNPYLEKWLGGYWPFAYSRETRIKYRYAK